MKNPGWLVRGRWCLRFVIVLVIALAACTQQPPVGREAIIPDTTKVADPATRAALTAFDLDTGEMRFSTTTPLLASLQLDDVIVAEPSEAAPYGYLRKVKSKVTQGSEVVLQTTQANLTDAIHQGWLDASDDLEADDLVSATSFVEGVTVGLRTAGEPGDDPHLDWYSNRVGLSAGNAAAVTLASGAAHDNSQYGLEASQSATLALTGVDVYGNALGGVYFGASTLTMRDSEVRDNPEFGLYVHGQPLRIDLGTFSQPGGNALHGNAALGSGSGGDQILDARPARGPLAINEKIAFTASATTLNSQTITPDVYPGAGIWPYFGTPYFSILEQNNYIQFY